MLISGSILLFYHWHQTERLTYEKVKNDRIKLLFIALCTTLVPALLKAWSLKHMLASKQSLLGSIDPFITALMVYVMFNEKMTIFNIVGMAIGFLGTIVVILSKTSPEMGYEWLWHISYPEIAIIAAVIISRYGWILVQTLLRNNHYTPIQINTLMQLSAGAMALGCAAVTNQLQVYDIASYPVFIAASLFTIFGGNIIGYTLYAQSLKHHSATLVSLAGFSIPLLVTFFAYIFLGEAVTPSIILGGFIIFLGLLVFYTGNNFSKLFRNS
jgi:drug/metabolite transporter (DMT)-like permease